MSEETEDKKDDGRVSVNYRISKEAKDGLITYCDKFALRQSVALSHILECIGRNPDAIESPSQYAIKFDLGQDAGNITIANCDKCKDSFSPATHGTAVENFLNWVEKHKDCR